jgi:DNA-binding NtrC family response regulator
MTIPEEVAQQDGVAANRLCASWLSLEQLAAGSEEFDTMVGGRISGRRLFSTIQKIAPHKSTVLVEGESGTGKELVAKAIHRFGPYSNGPFVNFSCANIVDAFAESQLFGRASGTFSDTPEETRGYFRAAHRGTLFLDEVAELPFKVQPKLLHALEAREFQPIGSTNRQNIDLQIIAATNRDLRAMVRAGAFRADLYYRLSGVCIELPRLRDCRDAIPPLIANFIRKQNEALRKDVRLISSEALELLYGHSWPGNVRELSHAIEYAMLMTTEGRLGKEDFPPALDSPMKSVEPDLAALDAEPHAPASTVSPPPFKFSLASAVENATKEAIKRALTDSSGSCVEAARLLGISKNTLYHMLKRFGFRRERVRFFPSRTNTFATYTFLTDRSAK